MYKLILVELLKLRRSLALLMAVIAPLLVVSFNSLMLLKRTGIDALTAKHWTMFWLGSTALWGYFMLPLYIALVTALLNGQEHRNQGWRLMLTLPVSQSRLYMAKALLAWLLVAGSNLVLVVSIALVAALLSVAGAPHAASVDFPMLEFAAKLSLGCLPILFLQHAVAWRFQNLMVPLALGVFATMGVMQMGSSEYWIWYPWAYPVMATNGGETAIQQQAVLLAAALAAPLFAASTLLLGRREVQA